MNPEHVSAESPKVPAPFLGIPPTQHPVVSVFWIPSQSALEESRERRSRFERYLGQAGLSGRGYTLHSLRHTCASELLNAGMRLECLQQLLGHSCIEMTRRYARLTDTTRREEYFRAMGVIETGGLDGHY